LPLIIFESPLGAPLEAECPGGGRIVDLCDDRSLPVPFSCRGGTCGTCLVVVTEGAHLLEDPAQDERELLAILAEEPPRLRLACQSVARAAPGIIRIRPART
jgi:ferredoxin